ncbi:hypothetical protein tpqmel_0837 [Candidatus Gastranaerophilus sp. (ex Termes propinquus)]|nr:hypothetical protein tpqmel_0837 [Candidatus Gastranaerophilus sp. (ex Termes propinquus)]
MFVGKVATEVYYTCAGVEDYKAAADIYLNARRVSAIAQVSRLRDRVGAARAAEFYLKLTAL